MQLEFTLVGEIIGAIAGGEVLMDRDGATPPRYKDGVEVGGVATVGQGADFDEEAERRLGWQRGHCGAQSLA